MGAALGQAAMMRALRNSLLALLLVAPSHAAQREPLELIATIPMPHVKGRIDHLAFDAGHHRLFIAALGNDTLEVVDVQGGAERVAHSVSGFAEPQGVVYVAELDRLYVANGRGNRVDVVDGTSLKPLKRITDVADADNVRYDLAARKAYVGYGSGGLRVLDVASSSLVADIRLSGHPESFQLEQNGPRIFVNVPAARHVAVVDRLQNRTIATWSVPEASANFPMALDENAHRLFVGARQPPLMLVYDTDSGKVVGRYPIGGDTDDIFFDAKRRRVYVVCGEGRIDVFRQENADRYLLESSIKTAAGARTGLFVPDEERLYVAAPAAAGRPAHVLVYRISG
jgi:DNA-binding beta-propeller fold protein YncE